VVLGCDPRMAERFVLMQMVGLLVSLNKKLVV
jgi:hypothetical protein